MRAKGASESRGRLPLEPPSTRFWRRGPRNNYYSLVIMIDNDNNEIILHPWRRSPRPHARSWCQVANTTATTTTHDDDDDDDVTDT